MDFYFCIFDAAAFRMFEALFRMLREYSVAFLFVWYFLNVLLYVIRVPVVRCPFSFQKTTESRIACTSWELFSLFRVCDWFAILSSLVFEPNSIASQSSITICPVCLICLMSYISRVVLASRVALINVAASTR